MVLYLLYVFRGTCLNEKISTLVYLQSNEDQLANLFAALIANVRSQADFSIGKSCKFENKKYI